MIQAAIRKTKLAELQGYEARLGEVQSFSTRDKNHALPMIVLQAMDAGGKGRNDRPSGFAE